MEPWCEVRPGIAWWAGPRASEARVGPGMQAKEASNVEPSALGQSVMAAQSGRRAAGGQGKGARAGICQRWAVNLRLVASHDVARLLAGM